MFKPFFCALVLGALTFSNAFAQSPIDGQITDQIYVETPAFKYSKAENKNIVTLYFDTDDERCRATYGDYYYSVCRPSLNLSGQPALHGISIDPQIKGEWRWESDYALSFTPSEYWLADQSYSVDVDMDALGMSKRITPPSGLRKQTITLKAEPLAFEIKDMRFMQDPDDPARKFVTARLEANYPAQPETLEEKLQLELTESNGTNLVKTDTPLEHDLQFAANHMQANLSVPIKTLPDKDRYLHLKLDAGIQPEFGGQLTNRAFTERARVPSLSSYLKLDDIAASISRTENGTPEQILSMSTNVKAKPTDLKSKISVYLLPFDHPVMKRAKGDKSNRPYAWRAANEVTPPIIEASEKLELSSMPDEGAYTSQFGFGFKAPEGRYLYVKVDKGLEAFGGYTMARPMTNIVQIPDIPNDIKIMQEGSILTLSGAKKLSLHARGTDTLKIEVAQIRPEALQHFISQTKGDIQTPEFQNWNFDEKDIASIDVQDIAMAYADPYRSQYASFDFAPYLKDGRKGIFLLNIAGLKEGKPVGNAGQRFVLVSDIGLLVKKNQDNSREVFAASFQSGKPVSGAALSVLSLNGLEIFTGKTDQDGHISLPDFSGYTKDRQPVAIVAQKEGDYSFIPYERQDRVLNISRFDVGGNQIAAQGLNAFLFSDRGIYRPGESAHIGMIVKNADWAPLPDALPLKAIVTDPTGRTVVEKDIPFSAQGLEELSFDTTETSPTGEYYINLFIANDGKPGSLLGSTSVRVEDFVPDRLKIKTHFTHGGEDVKESTGWVKPAGLSIAVDLANLYGTPASKRRITAAVTLNPARLSFKNFEDYRFFDPYAARARMVQYDVPASETDAQGKASLDLLLDKQEQATYSLTVQTSGFEASSGKGVNAYSTALVSPMDYALGFKSEANLNYLSKDKSYGVELIALDPLLNPTSASELSLQLVKINYISSLIRRGDGAYVYESVPKEEVMDTQDFAIENGKTDLSLPTKDLGRYVYRVKDKDGLVLAEIPFSIAGEGQRKQGLDREAVLDVKTNKNDYAAGETMEINISAPYTGAGLITLESDHVVAYKWFKTDKTETLQNIAIPKEFSGKGYVNVSFVRDINSREIYMSPLSNAIVPFTAGTDQRRVEISLNAPEVAKPGEEVSITYKGNKKGKAILFAIDEGILQVAKYKTPDPVDFFLINRALQVETSQMLDLLMPDYELIKALSANGGGASLEEALLGKHLNPFQRKILAPAVYWSGIVDLDTEEKTLTFTPPGHFNGELRVMAVAVGDGEVGSAQTSMNMRGDIVLTPNTPLFMAPGDTAEASVTIANNLQGSGSDAKVTLSIEPSAGLTVVQAPQPDSIIAEGTEESLSFTVKATESLGPSSLIVHASIGNTGQAAEATLSIRPSSPNETTMQAGYAEKGKADITLTRAMYPDFAEKSASISPLPSAYISGLTRYLDGYPYGCSEQITSKSFPKVALMSFPEFAYKQEDVTRDVAATVDSLRQRQFYDGGFSMWGPYESDPFISAYVMDFLLSAYDAGQPVPTEMIESGLQYLRDMVNQDIRDLNDARIKAYGIYLLTRSGIVTSNEILHFLHYFKEAKKEDEWKSDLSAVYIAASYEMMQQKKLAESALEAFEQSGFDDMSIRNIYGRSYHYSPFIKYAQYISILARHFPDRFAKLDRNIVFKLADYIQQQNYNTLSASYGIQGLSDYAMAQGETLKSSGITLAADGADIALNGEKLLRASLPITAQKLDIGGSSQPLFYTITETGYSKSASNDPVIDGMDIQRSYKTEDGADISGAVPLGDVIVATIKVQSHDNRHVDNVAIVDLLPAGFALEPDTYSSGSTLVPEFVQRREDRILIFGAVDPYEQVYSYRLRAVSKGTFEVPPPYAEAMYDLSTKARGLSGTITVDDAAE